MMEYWLGNHSTRVTRGGLMMDNGANMLKAVHDDGFVGICFMVYIMHG